MYVAMAQLTVAIDDSHSLKEKRVVVRRIKDRVRERLGVAVSEVGSLDVWQRAELGCAVASADRQKALELIDAVVRIAMSASGGRIVAIAKDAWTFDVPAAPVAAVDDRTGAADKAAGAAGSDDDDWIPAAWRDEPDA